MSEFWLDKFELFNKTWEILRCSEDWGRVAPWMVGNLIGKNFIEKTGKLWGKTKRSIENLDLLPSKGNLWVRDGTGRLSVSLWNKGLWHHWWVRNGIKEVGVKREGNGEEKLKTEANLPSLSSVDYSQKGIGCCWFPFSLWAKEVRVAPWRW